MVKLTRQCKVDYFKSYFGNNQKKPKRNMKGHQGHDNHKKV